MMLGQQTSTSGCLRVTSGVDKDYTIPGTFNLFQILGNFKHNGLQYLNLLGKVSQRPLLFNERVKVVTTMLKESTRMTS